jgi:coenzyme F420-0:L-glutamate ligase / coenzyme F420-1:gamma-L-glutamate ligase
MNPSRVAIPANAATLISRHAPVITMAKNLSPPSDAELAGHIGGRRSVRRYQASSINRDVVQRLLTAAGGAPSAHNKQPWRFVVLDTFDSRHALAQAMGRKLRQDRTADGDAPELIEADIDRSYQRITQAPIAIVLCVDMRDMQHYPDQARNDAEYLMAVQSTAMAAQNLLLAARAEGLGACIMCAPLFCPDVVIESLKLAPEWRAQMLVTIGEPAAPGKERPRLPLDQITQWHSDG